MAKAKTSKKKPAKKQPAKKRATRRKKIISSTDVTLTPKQRDKALKKLKKLSLPPSHPSEAITGPALELGYDAPLPVKKVEKRKAKKRAKATKRKR